ncbi:hypothetical protein [Paenibacillus lutrae]|uniref:Uncharacterized protein n=1 Tax=Paenibacillus lutrae TaxID=2078573 RepID=A0A7X3FJZ5_9BACL|nr:hypothetical protein [Paenibacillus lutrae]MVP00737.1 hypothetical protein [Paenibacillus lutrae]
MKWIGVLSKWAVGAVLMSFLSIFTTYVVVTTMVDEVLKHFQLPPIGAKIGFPQIVGKLGEQIGLGKPGANAGASVNERVERIAAGSPSPSPSRAPSPAPTGASQSTSGSVSGGTEAPGQQPSASPVQGGVSPQPTGMPDAVAVMGELKTGEPPAGGTGADKKDVVVSTEDFSKKKDSLSGTDKQKILSILIAKLPSEEVQKLSKLVEDGITAEELKEVDGKMKQYLSKEEYEQLSVILKKYGS